MERPTPGNGGADAGLAYFRTTCFRLTKPSATSRLSWDYQCNKELKTHTRHKPKVLHAFIMQRSPGFGHHCGKPIPDADHISCKKT
eukprot:3289195-Amphidinium_carterae.2